MVPCLVEKVLYVMQQGRARGGTGFWLVGRLLEEEKNYELL